MYHPKNIIEVLADNVRKTRNPFGARNATMNKWWKKAPLRPEGDGQPRESHEDDARRGGPGVVPLGTDLGGATGDEL